MRHATLDITNLRWKPLFGGTLGINLDGNSFKKSGLFLWLFFDVVFKLFCIFVQANWYKDFNWSKEQILLEKLEDQTIITLILEGDSSNFIYWMLKISLEDCVDLFLYFDIIKKGHSSFGHFMTVYFLCPSGFTFRFLLLT